MEGPLRLTKRVASILDIRSVRVRQCRHRIPISPQLVSNHNHLWGGMVLNHTSWTSILVAFQPLPALDSDVLLLFWRVAHKRMKSICCLVWILTALVIATTVDRVPDPPATRPNATQFRVSGPLELLVSLPSAPVFAPSRAQSERSRAFYVSDLPPRSHRVDPLERATDPSPPRRLS